MARDLNKVQFTGHLGGDPEMRYTPTGAAVTNFRVASNRAWKDRDGNPHEDTEWFRVVAWDKLAEICNNYLAKGTRVYIEGRLQTRKYTDRDGIERYLSEVIAQDMIILSSRGDRQAPPGIDEETGEIFDEEPQAPEPAPAPAAAPAAPARPVAGGRPRTTGPARPPRNQPQPIESDDDIPF
jgi:single-strand DNA-binding protein